MSRTGPRSSPWRGLLAPGLAFLVALAILVALGTWQLQRRTWKADLIQRIEAGLRAEPGEVLPEARWPGWRAAEGEFRRVRLTGRFLHDQEILVHGLRSEGPRATGLGYYVFTPIERHDGSVVLVNRGFVPAALKDPARRADGRVAGPATVTGLVRAPEARSLFVPADEPGKGEWFTRDTNAMARARGLSRAAPFYVEADATPNPGGWPKGGGVRVDLPNNHLQYALTWFGLALTLVGVFAGFAWQRARRLPGESATGPELRAKVG